jgi:hypothetical protein
MSKPLERSEVRYIEDMLEIGKPVLVTGEAGAGKSGIAYALCSPRKNAEMPVIYLDAREYSDLRYPDDLSGKREIPARFMESVRLVGQNGGCRLIIDQIDGATESSGNAFVALAKELSRSANMQVVALSRRQEGYERNLLEPLADAGFEQIPCNELSDSVAENTLHTLGISSLTDELVKLCRNLLNLDLVARMHQRDPEHDFSSISGEFDLWEEYIKALEKGERLSPHGAVFGIQVIAEATKLARSGLLDEEKSFLIKPPLTPERRRLESWGVIVPYEGDSYRFRHEKFRDFLYVRDAVRTGAMPPDVLKDVHSHRVYNILVWMNAIYPRIRPSKHPEFLRRFLNG